MVFLISLDLIIVDIIAKSSQYFNVSLTLDGKIPTSAIILISVIFLASFKSSIPFGFNPSLHLVSYICDNVM